MKVDKIIIFFKYNPYYLLIFLAASQVAKSSRLQKSTTLFLRIMTQLIHNFVLIYIQVFIQLCLCAKQIELLAKEDLLIDDKSEFELVKDES